MLRVRVVLRVRVMLRVKWRGILPTVMTHIINKSSAHVKSLAGTVRGYAQ